MVTTKIRDRERDTIIQALRAGVVPRVGLRHIQVGRARETEELVRDIERIGEGGSAIRFVIGEYGSGKTFFLNLIRLVCTGERAGGPVGGHHAGPAAPRNRRTGAFPVCGNGPQYRDALQAGGGRHGLGGGAICHADHQHRRTKRDRMLATSSWRSWRTCGR